MSEQGARQGVPKRALQLFAYFLAQLWARKRILAGKIAETKTRCKKKAHNHKLFGPVGLGTTPDLSQGQTQVFSFFHTLEARSVPGTNPVCPWDKPGVEGRHTKFMFGGVLRGNTIRGNRPERF